MIAAAMPHLPGVLHNLEPTLDHFGYLAVIGLVLIEDFGVPVPGETVLILAAVYAGTGRLNVVLVALLLFALIFVSIAHELPPWPLTLGTTSAAAVFVAAAYWAIFAVFGGPSLGAHLAQTASSLEENEEEAVRIR